MNSDQLQGKWQQLRGQVKQKWGKLTDDDLDVIEGNKDQLLGKLREKYGYSKEEASKELDNFTDDMR